LDTNHQLLKVKCRLTVTELKVKIKTGMINLKDVEETSKTANVAMVDVKVEKTQSQPMDKLLQDNQDVVQDLKLPKIKTNQVNKSLKNLKLILSLQIQMAPKTDLNVAETENLLTQMHPKNKIRQKVVKLKTRVNNKSAIINQDPQESQEIMKITKVNLLEVKQHVNQDPQENQENKMMVNINNPAHREPVSRVNQEKVKRVKINNDNFKRIDLIVLHVNQELKAKKVNNANKEMVITTEETLTEEEMFNQEVEEETVVVKTVVVETEAKITEVNVVKMAKDVKVTVVHIVAIVKTTTTKEKTPTIMLMEKENNIQDPKVITKAIEVTVVEITDIVAPTVVTEAPATHSMVNSNKMDNDSV